MNNTESPCVVSRGGRRRLFQMFHSLFFSAVMVCKIGVVVRVSSRSSVVVNNATSSTSSTSTSTTNTSTKVCVLVVVVVVVFSSPGATKAWRACCDC